MLVFFDTSVLVAASVAAHPHHARALPALRRVVGGEDRGLIGVHSIAEVYSALTRVPVQPRIHPGEAARIVREGILGCCMSVPAEQGDYLWALNTVQQRGLPGGRIYDALLLACAVRSGAERIYTFNVADFCSLAPVEMAARICAP